MYIRELFRLLGRLQKSYKTQTLLYKRTKMFYTILSISVTRLMLWRDKAFEPRRVNYRIMVIRFVPNVDGIDISLSNRFSNVFHEICRRANAITYGRVFRLRLGAFYVHCPVRAIIKYILNTHIDLGHRIALFPCATEFEFRKLCTCKKGNIALRWVNMSL